MACAVAVVATPVTRRALTVFAVFTWRLLPVLPHKLRLGFRDYSAARGARLAFEDLGPVYLKFGQMIASSPATFPPHVTDEFARCLDEVRPMSVLRVWKILERELGAPPEEVFASIDPSPLASASIAQVHAARLRSGEEVVVKVQRPGIERRIRPDVNLLGFVARVGMLFSAELRRANLLGIVRDFKRTLHEELDFGREADNIERFNALLEREGLASRARAPKVHRDLCTGHVLTMERFFGVRIDDGPGVNARVEDPVQLLRDTSEVFWTCVFLGGFFHGDIHAGNILVLDDGALGYIDFGIVGSFSVEHRVALASWVAGMVSGSGEQMSVALREMGAVPETVDWPSFVADISECLLPMRSITFEKKDVLEQFFTGLRRIANKHNTLLPQAFVLLLKQLTYFGRYVTIHDPTYNENTDPKSQQAFVKLFVKFNLWRQQSGGDAIAIRPAS